MRIAATHNLAGSPRRRGSLVVEFLLVGPILLLLLGGLIEFSLLLTARQEILHASREGARAGARGADDEEIREVVRCALGDGSLRCATVEIKRFCDCECRPGAPRERIVVIVRVPANHVTPDVLAWAGVCFCDGDLTAGTCMSMEIQGPCSACRDRGEGEGDPEGEGGHDR